MLSALSSSSSSTGGGAGASSSAQQAGSSSMTSTSSAVHNSSTPPPPLHQDFESFYHSVCSDLQNRGEVHSMSKLFATLTNDEDRVRFVLERNFGGVGASGSSSSNASSSSAAPLASWGSWRDFNFARKDRAESQRLRNLGNQVYQKNRLSEALEFYSQSVCHAPHPPPPNSFLLHGGAGGGMMGVGGQDPMGGGDDGSFTHEELALGYANRSAVLFQMKEYELCIRDITRAFDNSYPNNLMYKLFERKARCLKALRDYPRALESMKSAEMWMKYSTLGETKSSSFKKEISKQIEQLEEKVSQMSMAEFSESAEAKRASMQPLGIGRLAPRIAQEADGGESAEIPGVSARVRLAYTEERGRHLVATEDISPGDLLIVETPYSSVLLPEHYATHCNTCYCRVVAPIPCWCCAKVRFCSDDCRSEAWDRFHKVECQQLNLILDAGVGKNAMLAMRILTSSGKIYLEYVINKLREEVEARRHAAGPDAARQTGFNEDDVYDAADYRTIYTLVANSKHRGVGDLFKRSLMSLYLLKILEMTPFFYNGGSDPRNVKLQDKISMGAVILKHLQNLPCNAHELSEMELQQQQQQSAVTSPNSARDSTVREIGAACFGVLSLLNHSCDPNVVRHYYSATAAVRAIRTIRKGEELLDNYGYHYAVMSKEERQRKLHNQYYFHCSCHACACPKNKWTIYTSLNATPLPLPQLTPGEHRKALSDYQRSTKQYKRSFDMVLQGSFGEALPVLLEHLKFLDNCISRPLREYNDCQEAIKQCYSAQANCYKVKSGSGGSSASSSVPVGSVVTASAPSSSKNKDKDVVV